MASEALARRFRPAGFEQPEGSRRNYVKPRAELQEAFYQWLKELTEGLPIWEGSENKYMKAVNVIENFGEIKAEEANSLLIDFKPKTYGEKRAGLFVSACYTHSPEETVAFDMDASEIAFIGYRTTKNIFNNGKVGDCFAWWSSGLALNNGECGDYFTQGSPSIVVNNGGCGDWFARDSLGLAIAIKEPKCYGWKEKGLLLEPADCEIIPELKKYLEELSEITRNIKDEESAKRFLQRYGPIPKEKIEQDIKEILKKGVFQV